MNMQEIIDLTYVFGNGATGFVFTPILAGMNDDGCTYVSTTNFDARYLGFSCDLVVMRYTSVHLRYCVNANGVPVIRREGKPTSIEMEIDSIDSAQALADAANALAAVLGVPRKRGYHDV